MRRKLITLAVAAIAVVVPSGIAQAEPGIEVDPTSVDAAGEQEVTVTLSGFTPELAVFVLPCGFPAGGDVAVFDNTTCDQAQLSPVTIDADGAGIVTATYDVPAEGLAVYVTDAAVVETGVALITIGGGEDAAAETETDESAGEGDGTPAPTAVNTGEPVSGSSNVLLLGLAAGMLALAGGAMTLRRARH